MNKQTTLLIVVLATSAIGLVCFSIFKIGKRQVKDNVVISTEDPSTTTEFETDRPEIQKNTDENSFDKQSKTIFRPVLSDSENSLAICEFLSCCTAFKKAIEKEQLKENSLIMKEIQTYVRRDKALSSKEKENIEARINCQSFGIEKFEQLLETMVDEQNDMVLPFFVFYALCVEHVGDDSMQTKEFSSSCFLKYIYLYSDIQSFREEDPVSTLPKIVIEIIKSNSDLPYDSNYVQGVMYPSSIIFAVKPENRGDKLETHILIPVKDNPNMKFGYKIKAVLVKAKSQGDEKEVLKVLKLNKDLLKSKQYLELEKYIMKHAEYILYEKE
ncbi:hypothetical protein ENBRE01_1395 [Enteropsectra breve]|nr:hypothetical protein ENBRE01_1395 [Enteropsectra breve]